MTRRTRGWSTQPRCTKRSNIRPSVVSKATRNLSNTSSIGLSWSLYVVVVAALKPRVVDVVDNNVIEKNKRRQTWLAVAERSGRQPAGVDTVMTCWRVNDQPRDRDVGELLSLVILFVSRVKRRIPPSTNEKCTGLDVVVNSISDCTIVVILITVAHPVICRAPN